MSIPVFLILVRDFRNQESTESQPLFYSHGLFEAKKQLKELVARREGCERIYPFHYSLDEFDDHTVAVYTDEKSRSLQVLRVIKKNKGWVYDNIVQRVTPLKGYEIVRVPDFEGLPKEVPKVSEEFEEETPEEEVPEAPELPVDRTAPLCRSAHL